MLRLLAMLGALLLAGCAANQLPGFQNTYYSYSVPEPLMEQIRIEFRNNGLPNARIARDNVGRVQLKGSYQNEGEVDDAFIIVQSIIGIKSTSPFYPEDIRETRWGVGASDALAGYTKTNRTVSAKPQKRALIIGINNFRDYRHLSNIQGEDDGVLVKSRAEAAGYKVTALLGKNATKLNIEAALKDMDRDLGPDDSLFIYISSHGSQPLPLKDGGDGRKMSIAAWDSGDAKLDGVKFNLNWFHTSVSDAKVQALAKKPTRNTRILIDTCYSGEMLKEVSDDSRRYILRTNGGHPEYASITPSPWIPSYSYAPKGIHLSDDSVASLLVKGNSKVSQRNTKYDDSGRFTLITATSDNQLSWGPPPSIGVFPSPLDSEKMLKGSIFTQAFFEYLDHYKGHIEPAFKDARTFTEKKVRSINPPADWRGPVPIEQVPRLEPPLSPANKSNLYQ
jgi:hypothetical protein